MQTYIIDIDDTLIFSDKIDCRYCKRVTYEMKDKATDEIFYVNALYDNGHTIILHTGRNWDCYDLTKKQLAKAGVKYHELVMGKPQGIYVDKDCLTTLKEVWANEQQDDS